MGASQEIVFGRSSDSKRRIGLRLTVLARLLRSYFDRQATEHHNITRSQWSMIAVVSSNPGATQRMIAEILEMSEACAGRLIDRLCADGLLERRECDYDRRARAVYLAKAAEPLISDLADMASALEERMFQGFSEKELDLLEDFMNRLHDNISRG